MVKSEHRSRVLLVFASILFVAILAEVALRIFFYPRMDASTTMVHRRSEDPELLYELRPGAETVRDGVPTRINADGFRDDPFPDSRGRNEIRLLILGDSVTAGFGVAMADAFPQVLERELNGHSDASGRTFTVLNLGVYGYATRQELRLLETRGLEFGPDLVVLAYVLNDPDVADAGQARYFTRSGIAILQALRDAWNRLAAMRRRQEYHHRIHDENQDQITADFRRLGEFSRHTGIPVILAVIPVFTWTETYPWLDIHLRLKQLAAENGLHYLDLLESLKAYRPDEVAFDIWHPNVEGHRIIASALRECVLERFGGP